MCSGDRTSGSAAIVAALYPIGVFEKASRSCVLAPLERGGKQASSAAGRRLKTVLLTEMIIHDRHRKGEHFPVALASVSGSEELLRCEKEAGVLPNWWMIFGQMNEPPGRQIRVGHAALTMAEYFVTMTPRCPASR